MSNPGEKTLAHWAEQGSVQRDPQHRCSNCRHFVPAERKIPGVYVGDDGHCRLLPVIVSYAHRQWCAGWQDGVQERRDEVTEKKSSGPPPSLEEMRHACQLISKLTNRSVKQRVKDAARTWANDHVPATSVLRDAK